MHHRELGRGVDDNRAEGFEPHNDLVVIALKLGSLKKTACDLKPGHTQEKPFMPLGKQ